MLKHPGASLLGEGRGRLIWRPEASTASLATFRLPSAAASSSSSSSSVAALLHPRGCAADCFNYRGEAETSASPAMMSLRGEEEGTGFKTSGLNPRKAPEVPSDWCARGWRWMKGGEIFCLFQTFSPSGRVHVDLRVSCVGFTLFKERREEFFLFSGPASDVTDAVGVSRRREHLLCSRAVKRTSHPSSPPLRERGVARDQKAASGTRTKTRRRGKSGRYESAS